MDSINQVEFKNNKIKKRILNIFLLVGFFILFSYYFFSAPYNNKDVVIHVSSNQPISSIFFELENKNAVKSRFTLKVFVKLFESRHGIAQGDYLINKKSPVWAVAWQLCRGHHNIEPIKITFREGLTNEEIANLLADKLAGFRKDLFLSGVKNKQGYLFPDTYFFFPLDQTDEIIKKFSDNFESRIKSINNQIKSSDKTLSQIIIMASILEGEAGGQEDVAIISGILWKRFSLGMPLQVDIDKSTYNNKGLPNKPLNNPGLMSIKAAINPKSSSYLYYLHDKNGNVHYAVTYSEHKKNINNYLK